MTLVVAALPAAASADKVIEAQTIWRFDASTYTIDQGEPLTFRNADALSPGPHNVTATDDGADGKPLFASKTIPNGQEAPVEGARRLTTGQYAFLCTVHPFMQATLVVTDQGTPEGSGSPPAADTRPPAVSVALAATSLRRVARRRRLSVLVRTDEAAALRVRVTARLGRRTLLVGTATAAADRQATITVRARAAALRALRRARRATLTVAVEARDAAGNVGTATAHRTLRR